MRAARRVPALAATIWHNVQTGQAIRRQAASRSLTAYDR